MVRFLGILQIFAAGLVAMDGWDRGAVAPVWLAIFMLLVASVTILEAD